MGEALHTEKPVSRPHDLWIAGVWAFAEATFFFIVPDVWLTRMALQNRRAALVACVVATGAALLGGAVMFTLGNHAPAAMQDILAHVPGISPVLVAKVRGEVESRGDIAMIRGPVTGTPYKIYAVEEGAAGAGFGLFLLWSVAARLPRFVLLTFVAAGAAAKLRKMVPERTLGWVHAGVWIAFYVGYFARFGW